MASAMESNTSITSLNVSDNGGGSEAGVALAGALVMNSTLTSLACRKNAIGTAAASAMAAEIELNRALVFLDLEENNLGPWFGRKARKPHLICVSSGINLPILVLRISEQGLLSFFLKSPATLPGTSRPESRT